MKRARFNRTQVRDEVMFTDSIEHNLALLRELLVSLPPDTRNQAKLAAATIERAFTQIQKDCQGNKGAALGSAFAIYMFAEQLVAGGKQGAGGSLIQLAN